MIEISYIGLELVIFFYVNDSEKTTETKLIYGDAMIGLSAATLVLVTIWMIWQFLKFLLDFKCIRDLIEATKAAAKSASKVHPEEEDNLKIELEREYNNDEMISHISGLSESREEDEPEDETIVGI